MPDDRSILRPRRNADLFVVPPRLYVVTCGCPKRRLWGHEHQSGDPVYDATHTQCPRCGGHPVAQLTDFEPALYRAESHRMPNPEMVAQGARMHVTDVDTWYVAGPDPRCTFDRVWIRTEPNTSVAAQSTAAPLPDADVRAGFCTIDANLAVLGERFAALDARLAETEATMAAIVDAVERSAAPASDPVAQGATTTAFEVWATSPSPPAQKEPSAMTIPANHPPGALAAAAAELRGEGVDAAWRVAAAQFAKGVRAPLVALLVRHLAPGAKDRVLRGRIAAFLETPVGDAMVALLAGGVLGAVPGLAGGASKRLGRELRVRAMATGGDLLADVFAAPMRDALAGFIEGNPAVAVAVEAEREAADGTNVRADAGAPADVPAIAADPDRAASGRAASRRAGA